MTKSTANKADLKPILEEDVARVALFLHQHMNSKFSARQWELGLHAGWYEAAPHYGFMLESNGEVVGAICTLYSEQDIAGKTQLICNPHTWCVLEPFRSKSVSLILSVIRQPDIHCSMYSPNTEGEEIFSYLGFKPLARDTRILLNVPTLQLGAGIEVGFDIAGAEHKLSARDRKCVEDHRAFTWLRFGFFSSRERHGFIIYKTCRYKRLPGANLLYVSDKDLFADCWGTIRTRLLIDKGLFTTRAEERLLAKRPGFSLETTPSSAKFYLSDSLPAAAFDYTYSELVALDL